MSRALSLALGFLLPIYGLPFASPVLLDIVRYGLIFVVSALGLGWTVPRPVRMLSAVLLLVALWSLSFSLWREDEMGAVNSALLLFGALVGVLVTRDWRVSQGIFVGLIGGVSLSAGVAILQVFDVIASPQHVGVGRVPGLSFSSPRLSMEIAATLSVLILLSSRVGRLRLVAVMLVPLCLIALFTTGSRIGVLALVAGIALIAMRQWIQRRLLFGTALVAGVIVWRFDMTGVEWTSLERIDVYSATSSGRTELAKAAVEATASHPLTGTGLDHYVSTQGTVPHTPMFLVGIIGGALPAIALLAALGYVLVIAMRVPRRADRWQAAAAVYLASAFVSNLLQPGGFFFGLEVAVPLFACVSICRKDLPERLGVSEDDSVGQIHQSAD